MIFDGQVALVTGAAGNIGRATAVRLASHGARIILADHSSASDALAESAALVDQAGHGASKHGGSIVSTFDVTESAQVDGAVNAAASEAGSLDLVFNNAGYQGRFENILSYDADDLRKVLDINVTGVFSVLQVCAQRMHADGRPGSIVNTASMAGVGGAPNMAAYSASKAAVIGLTKSAAKDLAPFDIRVNAISPAFIGPGAMWERQVAEQATVASPYYADSAEEVADQMIGQVPMRRYGSLDEVAKAAAFLLSDDASYITGFNVEVSGGAQ